MEKIRVLIVEDERLAAEDLSLRLENLRCEVVGIASTGKDALRLVEEKAPDVILMDIQLRGKMDGIQTAKIIHETQPVPVIFATAYGDDLHISRALHDANPYGFLHKPVDDQAAQTMMQIALSRFEKDQIILRINQLLCTKDELIASLSSVDNLEDIGERTIEVLALNPSFDQSWVQFWDAENRKVHQAHHGLSEATFNKGIKAFDLNKTSLHFQTFSNDPMMSKLCGKPAYHVPILIENKMRGYLGFTCQTDCPWDEKEIVVIHDLTQVVSQTIYHHSLHEEKLIHQRQIIESETRLKAILEKSTTGIYQVDDHYKFEYINDRLCEIFGRKREEIIGFPFTKFLGESRDLVIKRYEDRQAGKEVPVQYTLDIIRPDGEVRDLMISANSFHDASGKTKSTGHLLDITKQKEDQKAAEKNQKLRDILFGITSAAIQAKDVAVLYETIYHYINEIISTSNFLMAMLNKEDNRIYFPFERDFFDTEIPDSIPCDPKKSLTARTIVTGNTLHVKSEEIRELMTGGKVSLAGDVPSAWLGIPLKVNDEVIGAFVLQEYDGITHYDEDDVRMLDLAAGQVALTIDRVRKDDALRELADELSNANGMKELLLDVITHDLRNPAGVISSIIEMLEGDEDTNEMFDILKSSSTSLMKVIENATVLSKLSIGESIAKEDIDLAALITEVVSEFESQLSVSGLKINLHLPGSLSIQANPILSEIPKNYISNAIKYASDGGEIELILRKEDGRVVFRVNDYGTPIPEDKREAVFQRSIQLAKGKKKGRGLGLAIVKRIADAHDAEVGVMVSAAGGNSFYLKF